MGFDVYSLIQSEEVREYLRKHRKFKALEQEVIIRNSYYTIEQKLEFMKQLLTKTKEETSDDEELELLEEKVRMYEFVVNFIHNPGDDVIYMAQEDTRGYDCNVYLGENAYIMSEKTQADTHYFRRLEDVKKYWGYPVDAESTICVDMILLSEQGAKYNADEIVQPIWFEMRIGMDGKVCIISFGMDDTWFLRKGFSERCVGDYYEGCRSPLPFESGCRIKLQTPNMIEPVYGILDSLPDGYGCWYHFLYLEDTHHDFNTVKKLIEEGEIWKESGREVDVVDLSYPILDRYDEFLTYDWIERADAVN